MKTKKLDLDEILDAIARDDSTGFCVECGADQGGCEPDARRYKCESCDALAVYGAEELVFMFALKLVS